ncbi:ribose-phosphate pyrophosphokinase [Candidatus Microgenomates bacterium]|nr:ribose-phosphate pyrophosphokinase [Candidatus Microgenomates bacterium]
MKIFTGSSNQTLVKKIAKELKIKLGKIELSRFANGEARVWIKDDVVDKKAIVVQSFSSPPDEYLMEFCLICDALKRLGVKKIIAVIPWLGYCVQDKVFRPGEPLSSKVIAKILQSFKIDQLITLDLHNETIAGFFDFSFSHLSAVPVFVDYFIENKVQIDSVISPDIGAVKKASAFARALNLPLSVINKKRNLVTGKVSILGVSDEVKGKKVLIVDDFISTGGTLIKTAHFLKEKGVKEVYAAITHHFYVHSVQEKVDKSQLDKLFVTDTIAPPKSMKSKKLKIISVSKLLANVLKSC